MTSVHPRTPGENAYSPCSTRWIDGPPPHAGGKRHELLRGRGPQRSTPARRVNPVGSRWTMANTSVHPRTTGENVRHGIPTRSLGGPPPYAGEKITIVSSMCGALGPPPHNGGKEES